MRRETCRNFKGKNILVVGLGSSGTAAVRFFLRKGAKVSVTDQRPLEELPSETRSLVSGFSGHFGDHPPEIFAGRDLLLVSPGVPLNLPGLQWARKKRIPIVGEFGLAASLLRRPVVAVTGTNGKSTTVTLIFRMLKESGFRVSLAGNIGKPLLEIVMENRREDWVVTEVSSYQLETALKFHPRAAVLLNITEDHLDRYRSFQDYARAKLRIFREQGPRDLVVYNKDDPVVCRGVRTARSKKCGFSLSKKAAVSCPEKTIFYDGEAYPLSRTRLVGLHNVQNIMAAVAVSRFAGARPSSVQKVIETFEGLPHRIEFVREKEGVVYYDDSKGTNVDAAVQSLSGFSDGRVILIAGGRDKGGSYEPLRRMAEKKVKLLIAIGEARERIALALQGATDIVKAEKLEEAVTAAGRRAVSGDVVLLSPACSSFDQFRDYKERGDRFQALVKEL